MSGSLKVIPSHPRCLRARRALSASRRKAFEAELVSCLRDSQCDTALHEAKGPIDLLCYVRSEACVGTRASIFVHLWALPA